MTEPVTVRRYAHRANGRPGWKRVPPELFHDWLWRHADERNRVAVNWWKLGEVFDINPLTCYVKRDRLVADHKIREVHRGAMGIATYEVTDPGLGIEERGSLVERPVSKTVQWM